MHIIAEPNWKKSLPKSALNSLSNNAKRTIEGSDEIIANPAYDSVSDDKIADRIESILSKVYVTSNLRKIEDANRDKFGPRSLAKKWVDRKASLSAYYEHKIDYDPGKFERIVDGPLRPTTEKTVASNLLKASSAGLPYMTKKGLVVSDAVAHWRVQKGKYPCVLYTRTQEQGKTRNVWGYPIADTIWEQLFFIPILAVEKTWFHRAALRGPDHVDTAVTSLLMGKRDDEIVYCVDFSAYDASVRPKNTYHAFEDFASLFQEQYHEEIYDLYRRFVSIGILTPEGEYSGIHGVPSGSSFTNTIDSEVQYRASNYHEKCQIQGDDGLYLVNKSELDLLGDMFITAGLELNDSKSEKFETKEAIYLQRYYHEAYTAKRGGLGGVYSAYRAFSRIKYLERWTDFKKMGMDGSDFFSLRTITILENCKHHPAFEELVRLALSFDDKGLSYSEQGLRAYSKAQESKARAGVYNQYGLEKGIGDFETVKLLNKL